MDSLVGVFVLLIAVAQALTILLTLRRERDIRELGKLVDEQQLRIVELTAWLAGRNAAQRQKLKSEREPISGPIADNNKTSQPAITSTTAPDVSNAIEGDAAKMMKVLNWQREIIAGLRSGLKESTSSEPVTTAKDPSDAAAQSELERTTNVINWLKEDAARSESSQGTPPAKKIG